MAIHSAWQQIGLVLQKETDFSFYRLYYHIVWSTKHHEPVLTPAVEALIYTSIREKAAAFGGTVFALNGCLEHTHLVTGNPARIAVSEYVRHVKGYATYQFNHSSHPERPSRSLTIPNLGAFPRLVPTFSNIISAHSENLPSNGRLPGPGTTTPDGSRNTS